MGTLIDEALNEADYINVNRSYYFLLNSLCSLIDFE